MAGKSIGAVSAPAGVRLAFAGATGDAGHDDDGGPDGEAAAGATPEAAAGNVATAAALAMGPTVRHAVGTAKHNPTRDRTDRLDWISLDTAHLPYALHCEDFLARDGAQAFQCTRAFECNRPVPARLLYL